MESEEEAGWIRGGAEREVDVVTGAVGVGRILSVAFVADVVVLFCCSSLE